ncbi:ventrally expressed dharma/bozozok antagonist [Archocentrus centrarchus]|uniref:ventrally expressed dharma/bozozok antagonist n=1 Tax=Archocentrus centrarchus TaxID=63155 RepID=UPI0011EA3656|nr:homeobox protein vent1-like [Archocentrus centrarchus]
MNGHFSIEWMAQSSQQEGSETTTITACGPMACGTLSESLPGFYCRQKSENLPKQEKQENMSQALEAYSQTALQQQTAPNNQVTEIGFSSGTEEETSGYDSESGHSLSPSVPTDSKLPPSPPVGRRPRTAFTAEQISSLEKAFSRNPYLGTQDKAELCKKLHLSDKQIRNWFQNRRMKVKRTMQDALAQACQANVCQAPQFMHYPELQTFRPGPYPRYRSAAAVVPEGPAPASYIYPHNRVQFSSPIPSIATLPMDSFYQYSSLPGVMVPSATSHLRESYSTYPPYY